jgi:VCBS repeat-containing protein
VFFGLDFHFRTYVGPNTAPVAADDDYSTNEDTALTGSVLSNDSDVDGTPLTAVKVSDPAHGTLALNSNGRFTYTPAANYNGSDSFSYKANDGTAASGVVTVNLTVNAVNDVPTIAVAAGGQCRSDSSGLIKLTLSRSSPTTTLLPVNNVVFGGSGANRTATITSVSGKTGSATITITVSDGQASRTTTVTVQAGGNGKDTLIGTDGADILFGQNGDDTLNGKDGIDLLCGGSGNDTFTGGAGADSFDGGKGTDRATDYNASEGDSKVNIP